MSYINPNKLLTHTRFDVIIKYLYGKSLEKNYNTTFYKEMYKEHLRLWNDFKEYDNPNKNSFDSFDNEFKNILNSIKVDGFDPTISKIPTHNGKYILNGAHRLASALVYGKPVFTVNGVNGRDGMVDCGYKFFQNLGLSERYCDRVAIEYAKLKKNCHMVFVFPAAKGKEMELYKTINQYGKVFYDKSVDLDKNGSFNLMRELYLDEGWAGNYQTNFNGYRHKQKLCYPDYSKTRVFLVEFDSIDISVKAKEAIRSIFGVGKHSVHINDTHEETVRLSKLMFNNNSIHHLNKMKTVNYVTFNSCLNDFKQHFKNNKDDIDDYCVGGSSSLSAYGLREGNDLDYLHCNPNLVEDTKDIIHSHNDYGVGRYHLHRDEIIHNPDNHFYHRGVKFASLDVIKKLKEKRDEPKDKNDINLIINV